MATSRPVVAELFRRWGHLQAALDPLEGLQPLPVPELDALPAAEAAPLSGWPAPRRGFAGALYLSERELLPTLHARSSPSLPGQREATPGV